MFMYKKWIKGKLPMWYLVFVLVIASIGLYLGEKTKVQRKYRAFDQQIEAAQIMKASLEEIKTYRLSCDVLINKELDPNETGIIGEEFTDLTTSLGDLVAKRTSTNPAFAALMVRYFTEAGLKRGDVVAIGASGSFPALILATLSASKAMELTPLLIYSLGSSMYGANIPEFTFLRMLEILNKKALLPYKPIAISLGGGNDKAEGLFYESSKETFLKLAKSAGIPLIYEKTLTENVQKRVQLYEETAHGLPIACFVNIGGATPNLGNTTAALTIPNGLVRQVPTSPVDSEQGLLFKYANRGIPVIHLLNIKNLAVKNGLPLDPVPLPRIGESKVYYIVTYNKFIIIIVLVVVVFWVLKR